MEANFVTLFRCDGGSCNQGFSGLHQTHCKVNYSLHVFHYVPCIMCRAMSICHELRVMSYMPCVYNCRKKKKHTTMKGRSSTSNSGESAENWKLHYCKTSNRYCIGVGKLWGWSRWAGQVADWWVDMIKKSMKCCSMFNACPSLQFRMIQTI